MKSLACALLGALFAVGLVIAQMTNAGKVLGFLDFGGDWDPSLLWVMVGAIGVHALSYRLVTRRTSPLFGATFAIPARGHIDAPLVVGASLFGIGWGLGGYCPGPALVSLFTFDPVTLTFVAGMALGMLGFAWRSSRVGRAAPALG
jgi:uncharacterized protein